MITQDQLIKYTKYNLDSIYAIEDLFKIVDGNGRMVPLKLTFNQKNLIDGIQNYRFNIVKKTNYVGSDTALAAWIAVRFAFQYDPDNPDCFVYCSKMIDISYDFIKKVRFFLEQIPLWAWPKNISTKNGIYSRESRNELVLINHCRIKGISNSRDAMRGFGFNHFFMEGAAECSYGGEVFSASMCALGTGGQATLVSTPNGYDNFFEPMYSDAEKMRNHFNSINMHWAYDPRFNEGLTWSKDGYVVPETEFTQKSISYKMAFEWKPTSIWSEKIAREYYNSELWIEQDLYGQFVQYKQR